MHHASLPIDTNQFYQPEIDITVHHLDKLSKEINIMLLSKLAIVLALVVCLMLMRGQLHNILDLTTLRYL